MLSSYPMLGFVLTTDAARARSFYEDVLGLEFMSEDPYGIAFHCKDSFMRAAKVASFTPAQHTILGWAVTDIENVVDQMAARGVHFERYPGMPQDERGIWNVPDGTRVAWFKDPDGNVLSVSQHPAPTS